MKRLITLAAAAAFIALTGCTTAPIHNDQRNCTHNCNIGSSGTPVYSAPVVYHRPAPVIIHSPPAHRHYPHHQPGWRVWGHGSIIIH